MGFFKDFKRDFAQAVNELMPDKDELAGEYDDEDMVNTFDDNDNMDIAPEDLIDDLDDFSIENRIANEAMANSMSVPPAMPVMTNVKQEEEPEDNTPVIPEAEIITDMSDIEVNTFDEDIPDELVANMSVDDTVLATPEEVKLVEENASEIEESDEAAEETTEVTDELKALEELDESNMEEELEAALSQESTEEYQSDPMEDIDSIVGKKVNISKDVSDAILKREEEPEEVEEEADDNTTKGNEDWEGSMSEIEQVKNEEMKDSNIDSILADDTTYITKGTVITGSISTEGCIDIIGTVNGDVSCGGKLILGGNITGNVKVGELYANAAKIEGEVVAENGAKVGVGSVIVGNITATSAVIAGAVNGDIDVKGPVIVDSTAVIMGNIKSRSVQINNGAVIEGFCSQCYSEIDVKSFFE